MKLHKLSVKELKAVRTTSVPVPPEHCTHHVFVSSSVLARQTHRDKSRLTFASHGSSELLWRLLTVTLDIYMIDYILFSGPYKAR